MLWIFEIKKPSFLLRRLCIINKFVKFSLKLWRFPLIGVIKSLYLSKSFIIFNEKK